MLQFGVTRQKLSHRDTPRLRDTALLEHYVRDAGARQLPAHRKPGLACANHDDFMKVAYRHADPPCVLMS